MGNDGGSIPKRRELVKNASRAPTVSELKATALESLNHSWSHCALSGEPLDLDAAVSDGRGSLYNYEAILKGLMPSIDSDESTAASLGISSLRDVAKLVFYKNGDRYTCPISMKEMGPATKAVYLIPCGHVFAEIAMHEIQEKNCPECSTAFDPENVIVILPTTDKDKQRLASRLDSLRAQGLTHTLKKEKSDKKRKKRKNDEANENGEAGDDSQSKKSDKRSKRDTDSRISGINNPMAASLTAKVLAEQDARQKRRNMASAIASK
ncbi:hypothetical protein HIM_03798 [Hirsutella minnesotensis 3608]|uniref:Uncharacterized protein n=1 Tax=Hirsutella minnesotensis 3608 TaxID=1043627 RepID=A0A0F7ZM25_9HYPO|nr:hypothetical protein HIM_03798 [Hirsutella minnesotensis 3608]